MATSFELAGVESDHLKRQTEAADSARLESRIKDAAPVSDRPTDSEMVELDRIGPTDLGPAESFGEVQKRAELRREAEMLKQMQPALDQGTNADAFASWDKANGIGHYSFERYDRYVRGYEDVYHSYYGPEAVAVEPKPDGAYTVLNGRHRIEAAREVGLKKIPARVVG
jgi:hypothetical protein